MRQMDYRAVRGSRDRTQVVIMTASYRITGYVSLTPGARLTDFVTEADAFIAVTDAEVRDHRGTKILATSFLDVNRDHVEIIVPADAAREPMEEEA